MGLKMKITNIKEARAAIGSRVYWDDISIRYKILRSGILQEVEGKNMQIDGDWKWRTYLTNFRTTETIG
jgi:hypothetical protein